MKKFLHVGCGPATKAQTLNYLNTNDWEEVRYDIDPAVSPDIVGTMTDMGAVQTGSVDAVFSSHNIEHLYAHQVVPALREFHRVLKPDGFVVVLCPDLKAICRQVAEGKLMDTAYVSPAGPISAHDVLYGYGVALEKGNSYMAHNCGFTLDLLFQRLGEAGFAEYAGHEHAPFALAVVARKQLSDVERMRSFAKTVLGL
jgi:SAM-dependent methyltransferase